MVVEYIILIYGIIYTAVTNYRQIQKFYRNYKS